jgi:queuine tRNA-ribosyltransferase
MCESFREIASKMVRPSFFSYCTGSCYKDLRQQSAEYIANSNQVANAIGGLSVGEPAEEMYAMTEVVCEILPEDKPRYLMGVGTPINILENIALGVDMFDCVMPTRNARNGCYLLTVRLTSKKKNGRMIFPIDEMAITYVDTEYTKAYLRHLFAANEYLGNKLLPSIILGFICGWFVRPENIS